MVRLPNEHVEPFGHVDDSLGEHATNCWLVRIATSSQCDGCSDIFKQSCHHDGFARVTDTRSVYVSSLSLSKLLMSAGFFNVPVR